MTNYKLRNLTRETLSRLTKFGLSHIDCILQQALRWRLGGLGPSFGCITGLLLCRTERHGDEDETPSICPIEPIPKCYRSLGPSLGASAFFDPLGVVQPTSGSPERFSLLHFPSPSPPPSPSPSDEIDDNGWAKEDFDEASGLPQDPEPDPNMRFYGPRDEYYRHYHPQLSALLCDPHGNFLPPGAPSPAHVNNNDNWFPYKNQLQFETAEFLYSKCQISLYPHGAEPPFQDHRHLHEVIDATIIGDVKWQSFSVSYTGEVPEVNPPDWMRQKYDVWFCDPRQVVHKILGNPSFASEMDLRPFAEQYKDFMSGEWAWEQADIIAEDRSTVGSTFVPIILGSNKTTVSVATGNNEYYPLYLSVGNVWNNVRRAHRDALVLIGFLAIPKTTNEHSADANFCAF
ncbi:hypothetical protein OG21DRAFT_1528267 [Imleria badia]|nr:hypothetical protein OG21DRAFT_1528267 [Imleria badia]